MLGAAASGNRSGSTNSAIVWSYARSVAARLMQRRSYRGPAETLLRRLAYGRR